MRNRFFSGIVISAAVILGIGVTGVIAQPSAAQVKKDVSGPKTISVTVEGRGTRVWSKGYSKYVWDVPYTAKVKSEEPGVNILVEATASYDFVGGRYVYWRSFIGSNVYEGIPNPTTAEAEDLMVKFGPQAFMMGRFYNAVGPVESMKLASTPRFEWNNLNSVSFDVVVTYREKVDYTKTRRIAEPYRVRLYRDSVKAPWKSIGLAGEQPEGEIIVLP